MFSMLIILFLGNGILGPSASKKITEMEIKNPVATMANAKIGL